MATVTKSYDPENLTLKDAIEIIAAKVAKGGTAVKARVKAKAVKEPKETVETAPTETKAPKARKVKK